MIRFENIRKNYKETTVIDDVSFEINKGEIVVLIGSSGCGKTTLLKMINSLIKPTSGKIYINDEDIGEKDPVLLRRNIGYVIQQIGLFPHLTIRKNIEIIPRLQKMPKDEIYQNTRNLLNMVGLDPDIYMNRYPIQLSGGQNQRVGVARAFATNPEIILMDEPFSAVDPITRTQLQDEFVNLESRLHKTIVFVTHDMDEALKIADRICIIKSGKIVQYDTPENILKNPIDEYVTEFVGKNRIWRSPEFIYARDIMITKPVTTYEEVPILKVMENMRIRKVDTILILNDSNKYIGYATAKDINKYKDKTSPISMLTKKPKVIAYPYDSIIDLLAKIKEHNVSTIPVVDEDNVLHGLITTSTLVTTLSQQFIDFEEVLHD